MLLIVFIAFAALIAAWLVAPNGEVKAAPKPTEAPAPGLTVSEAGA